MVLASSGMNPCPLHPSSFFPFFFFSLKLIHLYLIKSLMKPDTFDATCDNIGLWRGT